VKSNQESLECAALDLNARVWGEWVVEIGCGDGRMTRHLMDRASRLIALDPDWSALRKCRDAVFGVPLVGGTGQNPPIKPGSCDAVVFSFSLHHQNSRSALEKASRLLRPDGQIIILEPVDFGPVADIFRLFRDEHVEIQRARQAVQQASLWVDHDALLACRLIFKDMEDLLSYFFGYYDQPRSPETVSRVQEILGQSDGAGPLCLEDVIRFTVLRRTMRAPLQRPVDRSRCIDPPHRTHLQWR